MEDLVISKDYRHGKYSKRKYYRSQRFDKACRPNGGCPYCESGRKHKDKRHEPLEEKDNDTNE